MASHLRRMPSEAPKRRGRAPRGAKGGASPIAGPQGPNGLRAPPSSGTIFKKNRQMKSITQPSSDLCIQRSDSTQFDSKPEDVKN